LVVDALGKMQVMNVLSLMKTAWSAGFDEGGRQNDKMDTHG